MDWEVGDRMRARIEAVLGKRMKAQKAREMLLDLYSRALAVAAFSYSPYSRFPVGAAILTEDGATFTGVNVENRSFGLTNCAERTAVYKAASVGRRQIAAVAIATPKAGYPVGPCGACRQVLTEFADADTPVLFGQNAESAVLTTLGALYPMDSLHELAEPTEPTERE